MPARFIDANISTDNKLSKLIVDNGAGLGLVYLLLIAQTGDDGVVQDATAETIKARVAPLYHQFTMEDIDQILTILHNHELVFWDKANKKILFPPETFYKYQTNIPPANRRKHHPPKKYDMKYPLPKRARLKQEYEEKANAVLCLIQGSISTELQAQIKEAIIEHNTLSLYQVKMAMLRCLDQLGGNTTRLGTWFSNALKWETEAMPDIPNGAASVEEWEAEYNEIKARARSAAEEQVEVTA